MTEFNRIAAHTIEAAKAAALFFIEDGHAFEFECESGARWIELAVPMGREDFREEFEDMHGDSAGSLWSDLTLS